MTLEPLSETMQKSIKRKTCSCLTALLTSLSLFSTGMHLYAQEDNPAGHWILQGNLLDSSGNKNTAINHGVDLSAVGIDSGKDKSVLFDGRKSYLEIPHSPSLALGTGDFSVSLWVHTKEKMDDNLGDLITKYDPETRRGFNLSLVNHAGVVGSQANYRNLQFGIDAGRQSAQWRDEGRPGKSIFIHSMAVHEGNLYAGTVEGRTNDDKGHVYRYKKTGEWQDLGAPWKSNGVTSMASFQGKLHVGVSRVLLHYSGLEPTLSHHIGGKVFRLEDDGQWTDLGQLLGLDGVNGLVNFKGDLYATGFYQPGFFRYEGGTRWRSMGTPDDLRTEALAVHNGSIYATSYDEGSVFRFDGKKWHRTGSLGTASRTQAYWDGKKWVPTGLKGEETGTQVYSLGLHQGKLVAGTWPEGKVYRYEGGTTWKSTGRLGNEQEIMGSNHYNGKLYAGSLPMAEIFRYDGDEKWKPVGRVDLTRDVIYRRAFSLAVFKGRLFSGTFPSGHVRSFEAGKVVSHDTELKNGWRHIAAVKTGGKLKLFIDGKQVAESDEFDAQDFNLTNKAPLRIGYGQYDFFNGRIRDVRIHRRALTGTEVADQARND
ncbi:MAG: LamG domain-containing protein [Gimesia sp.]|nr:LamG domain-containing protein [Gimesia sp.]